MILIDKKTGQHYENVAPGIINAKIKADPERWAFGEQITKEEAEEEDKRGWDFEPELTEFEKEQKEKEKQKQTPKPKRKRRTKAEIEADKLKENK